LAECLLAENNKQAPYVSLSPFFSSKPPRSVVDPDSTEDIEFSPLPPSQVSNLEKEMERIKRDGDRD